MKKFAVVLALAIMATGCAAPQKPLYYWGQYESVIYDIYNQPGEADVGTQIEKLTRTIQQAQNSGLNVPPGVFAHLGMIYAEAGNPAQATEAFQHEMELYPESRHFIEGMLARAGGDQ